MFTTSTQKRLPNSHELITFHNNWRFEHNEDVKFSQFDWHVPVFQLCSVIFSDGRVSMLMYALCKRP